MDRTQVCGTCNAGSIPAESTKQEGCSSLEQAFKINIIDVYKMSQN